MHLLARAVHGYLMTVISRSPAYLDRASAITRTGQFRHVQLQLGFPGQFRCALHGVSSFCASPHPLNLPFSVPRGRLFDPSQLLGPLQRP